MAKNDKQSEKKQNIFERAGLWSSEGKKDDSSKDSNNSNGNNTGSDDGSETPFVFDFTQATDNTEQAPVITEPVVAKKTQVAPQTNVIDPKIAEKLRKVLTESNFPGPDYFEFEQQLEQLGDVIEDEATRYKAAYKSLKVQGITKSKVLQSAEQYVGILKGESNKFEGAISQKNNTEIDLKTQEARVLNTENVNLRKQIAEIESKITDNNNRISVLGTEVQKAQNEIANAKKRFEGTLNGFINKIQASAQKVGSYIQE